MEHVKLLLKVSETNQISTPTPSTEGGSNYGIMLPHIVEKIHIDKHIFVSCVKKKIIILTIF